MTWKKIIAERDWFYSAQLPEWQKKQVRALQSEIPHVKAMLWMLSSGTQSVRSTKAIGLKHEAFLASAESVNHHLEATAKDRWAAAIPNYYVGGLSIYARAMLSHSRVLTFGKWSPILFDRFLRENRVTLTSLVPTQVHDLVAAGLRSPPALRAAVIGGGALSPELYARARELGWPVLTSYGLTETCSQVATASLDSLAREEYPQLQVLRHAEIRIDSRVNVKAKSLCSYIAVLNAEGTRTFEVPAPRGWYQTADIGLLSRQGLKILGRADEVVKIKGVLVPILEVEHELNRVLARDVCVLALADSREEHKLLLVVEDTRGVERALKVYNAGVESVRRIRHVKQVDQIPRGEMGKIKKALLRSSLE